MDPDPAPLFIIISTLDSTTLISIIILLILLVCSALISGAEVAFFSLTPTDLEHPETTDKKSTKLTIVARLLKTPKKLLATILVANNTINIAIVLLFANIGETLFDSIQSKVLGIPVRFI